MFVCLKCSLSVIFGCKKLTGVRLHPHWLVGGICQVDFLCPRRKFNQSRAVVWTQLSFRCVFLLVRTRFRSAGVSWVHVGFLLRLDFSLRLVCESKKVLRLCRVCLDRMGDIVENEASFYANAEDYWKEVPPTVDGMLGGYSSISSIDINGSKAFLNRFLGVRRVHSCSVLFVSGFFLSSAEL